MNINNIFTFVTMNKYENDNDTILRKYNNFMNMFSSFVE